MILELLSAQDHLDQAKAIVQGDDSGHAKVVAHHIELAIVSLDSLIQLRTAAGEESRGDAENAEAKKSRRERILDAVFTPLDDPSPLNT